MLYSYHKNKNKTRRHKNYFGGYGYIKYVKFFYISYISNKAGKIP